MILLIVRDEVVGVGGLFDPDDQYIGGPRPAAAVGGPPPAGGRHVRPGDGPPGHELRVSPPHQRRAHVQHDGVGARAQCLVDRAAGEGLCVVRPGLCAAVRWDAHDVPVEGLPPHEARCAGVRAVGQDAHDRGRCDGFGGDDRCSGRCEAGERRGDGHPNHTTRGQSSGEVHHGHPVLLVALMPPPAVQPPRSLATSIDRTPAPNQRAATEASTEVFAVPPTSRSQAGVDLGQDRAGQAADGSDDEQQAPARRGLEALL